MGRLVQRLRGCILYRYGYRWRRISEHLSHQLENDYALDLTVGDSDMDDEPEIYVLTQEGSIEVVTVSNSDHVDSVRIESIGHQFTSSIAMADHDGDSPRPSWSVVQRLVLVMSFP